MGWLVGGWIGWCVLVGCGTRRKEPWKKFKNKIGALQEISASPKMVSVAEVENTSLAIKYGSEVWWF